VLWGGECLKAVTLCGEGQVLWVWAIAASHCCHLGKGGVLLGTAILCTTMGT
jgi:hypothetical protein